MTAPHTSVPTANTGGMSVAAGKGRRRAAEMATLSPVGSAYSWVHVVADDQCPAYSRLKHPNFHNGTIMCFITIPGFGNHIITSDWYRSALTGRTAHGRSPGN